MYNSPDNFPFPCLGIIFPVIGRSVRVAPSRNRGGGVGVGGGELPGFSGARSLIHPLGCPPLEFRRGLTRKATELFLSERKFFRQPPHRFPQRDT